MAEKNIIFWFCLIITIYDINAGGQIDILQCPSSLRFDGHGVVKESKLAEIYFAVIGFVPQEIGSDDEVDEAVGLRVVNPMEMARCLVLVNIENVRDIGEFNKVKTFPIDVEGVELNLLSAIRHRVKQRGSRGNTLLDIKFSEYQAFIEDSDDILVTKPPKKVIKYLNSSVTVDYNFLLELEAVRSFTNSIIPGKSNLVIDLYNLRFTSLGALSDFHGSNSPVTLEAKTLLRKQILELKNVFKAAFGDRLFMAVVSTRMPRKRGKRENIEHRARIPHFQTPSGMKTVRIMVEAPVDPNAPFPIFNIFLWTGLTFILTLLAIVYLFMRIDPGFDTILYKHPAMIKVKVRRKI